MRTEIVWPAGCETWNAGERLDLLPAFWNLGVSEIRYLDGSPMVNNASLVGTGDVKRGEG